MKRGSVIGTLTLLVLAVVISGCTLEGLTPFNEAPIFPNIEGTIAVADSADWANVKVGIFTNENVTDIDDGTGVYRLGYGSAYDDSVVAVSPVSAKSEIVASGDDAKVREYYINLPSVPTYNEDYYVVAWYDTNANGKLELADTSIFSPDKSIVAQGEYNRFPVKDIDGTKYTVSHFWRASEDDTGYKYLGVPGSMNAVLESDDPYGFDFTLSATSGF